MHSADILAKLNEEQERAVCAPLGNSLVLAGAGTGKTRVLTHRIAWLVSRERMPMRSILAVTFTNKAAGEMRERISNLLHTPMAGAWIGTFHSIALRLLRNHRHEAGLGADFAIIDADDQLRMVKRLQGDMNISVDRVNPRQTRAYINRQKENGCRARNSLSLGDACESEYLRVYHAYEARCQAEDLVDFGEMLLRSLEMLQGHQDLLRHYRQVLGNVLVDEFQDTNSIQYDWLRCLAGQGQSFMAVGDDDQSIYGWRGAEVANMHKLQRDFESVEVYRLEQNYRSGEHILEAANAVIAHNSGRLGKNLWTQGGRGEPIRVNRAINEHQEADELARFARQYRMLGGSYREIAVLYRTHALSRVLERALNANGIPYRIYGGLRFFERAEIKDALAYMRLVATPDADLAFARVANTPTRKIGNKTMERLRFMARERDISLYRMAEAAIVERLLPSAALKALEGFIRLLANIRQTTEGMELAHIADKCIHASGLMQHHAPDATETSLGRRDNLEELVNACQQFTENSQQDLVDASPADEGGLSTPAGALRDFLDHASLGEETAQAERSDDCLRLMTIHSAKGLEFPVVYLVGVEEGIFPNSRAIDEGGLEEERRLFYVAMTRAMRELHMSFAEVRTRYQAGSSISMQSRFLAELPEAHVDQTFQQFKPSRTTRPGMHGTDRHPATRRRTPAAEVNGIRMGVAVRHARFGVGTVLDLEGDGDTARVQVRFQRAGSKWLVLGYAKLEVLGFRG